MPWLRNIFLVLNLRCREASTLLSRSQDTRLRLSERLAVRLHLLICRSCRRFSRQLALLRSTLRAFSQKTRAGQGTPAALSPAERERILNRLARALRKKK